MSRRKADVPSEVEAIARWREKPHVMVRELFGVTPDPWQDEVLAAFPTSPRIAMKASKGPGKTATLSWLAWNFLLTRPDPKVIATSITYANLQDGLWAEMAKWQQASELLKKLFVWQQKRIFYAKQAQNWFMSARTWDRSSSPDEQSLTLAGIHAEYVLFLIDEAGGIPDAVMAAAEAGLSTGLEAHIVIAGNPTHLEGPLYRACTKERGLWKLVTINGDPDSPQRSPRISSQWAKEQIEKYGRDNPWVLVNVFGEFPPNSINALIGPEHVEAAMKRHYRDQDYAFAPLVLGCDVARQGLDESVIFPRQGLVASAPLRLRIPDTSVLAGRLATEWRERNADAVFVDATGGYGAGVIDALRQMNRSPLEVYFSGRATNDTRFANKRAEIWWQMCEWIKNGGALPPELVEMVAGLSQTTYTFRGDRLILEDKDQIKSKIGRSPDLEDALACTFAQPVAKLNRAMGNYDGSEGAPQGAGRTYNPLDALRRR